MGGNLTKEGKDLCAEKYRIPMKESEEDTNKWKDVLHLQSRRNNTMKISLLLKSSLYIQCSLCQNPSDTLHKHRKDNLVSSKIQEGLEGDDPVNFLGFSNSLSHTVAMVFYTLEKPRMHEKSGRPLPGPWRSTSSELVWGSGTQISPTDQKPGRGMAVRPEVVLVLVQAQAVHLLRANESLENKDPSDLARVSKELR